MRRSPSTWRSQLVAIARRDLQHELSYRASQLLRLHAIFFGVVTLLFLGRLVPPSRVGLSAGGYFEFALAGLVITTFITVGLGTFARTLREEQWIGTLEILLASPLPPAVLLLGSMIVPLTLAALEAVVTVGVGIGIVGSGLTLGKVIVALPVLILTVACFASFGVLSAAFFVVAKRGDPVSALFGPLIAFLGGAVFPVALLPAWVERVAHLLPAYYSLHGLRAALLEGAGFGPVAGDLAVLTGFTVLLLPLSLRLFARALDVARVSGTLGTY